MNVKNEEIEKLYVSGKTLKEISEIYHCSPESIRKRLQKSSVKMRKKGIGTARTGKLNIDLGYFENIDSNEKAYWLGFLYADGYVGNNIVKLKLKDKEPIVFFKKAIKSEHKLCENENFDKRTDKIYKSYSIAIASTKVANDLKKIGLKDAFKNFDFPTIEKKFYSHFIRGVFDGDGGIYFIKKDVKKTRCDIVVSEKIAAHLCEYLKREIKFKTPIFKKITNNINFKIVCLIIRSPKIEFLNWIYSDSTQETRLNRKYQKYLMYKNYLESPDGIKAIETRSKRKDYSIYD